MKSMNVLGWYGRHNCGDEAFKLAFDAIFPGVQKDFTCESLLPADELVLGGGDVIKPFYLDTIGDRPFTILGAGLGYESELELLRNRNVKRAVFRNAFDAEAAKQMGIDARYAPDLCFAINAPTRIKSGGKKRAIVLLSDAINASAACTDAAKLHYAEYFKWELSRALYELNQWYDFTFVPFSEAKFDNDYKCILDVTHRIPKLTRDCSIFDKAVSPRSALALIACADLVISMKFHGLIFSTMCGVPFVNIGLSRKNAAYCTQEFDMSRMSLEPYSFTKDSFFYAVKCAEEDGISEKLLVITKENKRLLVEALANIF